MGTVEPLLRVLPDQRPPPLERPLYNVNLNINVLISTPDERPPLLKGHFSEAKGVASQEGFHCSCIILTGIYSLFHNYFAQRFSSRIKKYFTYDNFLFCPSSLINMALCVPKSSLYLCLYSILYGKHKDRSVLCRLYYHHYLTEWGIRSCAP